MIDEENILDVPICKYCFENAAECTSKLITPCKCTNPVCLSCLRRKIELKNVIVCEICNTSYNLTPDMGITIDPIKFNDSYDVDTSENYRFFIPRLFGTTDPLFNGAWPDDLAVFNHSHIQIPYPYSEHYSTDNKVFIGCCLSLLLFITSIIIIWYFVS